MTILKKFLMDTKPALIIFIRNPELGKVKTRIAKSVGDQKAYQVYLALLEHIRTVTQEVEGVERYLFYSHFIDTEDQWDERYFHKRIQCSGDIGDKMNDAFNQVLRKHSAAIIVGSDIASLRSNIIENAVAILHEKDYVLGPALDGGYYLLGMKKPSPFLFEQMIWSTDHVFEETTKRINKAAGSFELVDTLSDIDHWEDWQKYGWEL